MAAVDALELCRVIRGTKRVRIRLVGWDESPLNAECEEFVKEQLETQDAMKRGLQEPYAYDPGCVTQWVRSNGGDIFQ